MIFLLDKSTYLTNTFMAMSSTSFSLVTIEEVEILQKGDILLSLSDYNDMELDTYLTQLAKVKGFDFLRACIICNDIYVGPYFTDETACISCVMDRCKHNNKNADFVKFANYKLPLTIINVRHKAIEFVNYLDDVLQGKTDLRNRLVIFSNDGIKSSQIISSYECPICQDKSVIKAKELTLSERKKCSHNVHRIRMDFREEEFRSYLDKNFGIFKHEYRNMKSRYSPIYGVEMFLDGDFNESGFGRTYKPGKSRISAYLEAIERYSNSAYRSSKQMIRAAFKDIKDNAVNPEKYVLHNPDFQRMKTEFTSFSEDLVIDWIWGYSIKQQRPVLVPSQMVFYRDLEEFSVNSRFVYESSNGCALGSCVEEAIFHGLLEVIERDNFLVAWYNKLDLVEIDSDSLPRHIKLVVDRLNVENYSLRFFDITMELKIPSVWAILVDENEKALIKTFSAAGCSVNPENAIEAAMFEVITSLPIYQELFNNRADIEKIEKLNQHNEEIVELDDHIMLYAHKDSLKRLEFVLESNNKLPFTKVFTNAEILAQYKNRDLKEDLSNLMHNILAHHEDIIIVDISNNLTDTFSLKCVKVFAQGMLTMTFGENHKRINVDRVKYGPIISGRTANPIDIQNINKEPHPFP